MVLANGQGRGRRHLLGLSDPLWACRQGTVESVSWREDRKDIQENMEKYGKVWENIGKYGKNE